MRAIAVEREFRTVTREPIADAARWAESDVLFRAAVRAPPDDVPVRGKHAAA